MKKSGKLCGLLILAVMIINLIGFNVNVMAAAPTALPVISRGVPAFANVDVATNANDGNYGTTWRGTTPGWLAYDLSSVPAAQRGQVVAVWYNPDTYDYDPTILNKASYGSLNTYTIEGNAAAGGGSAPASGWVALATVANNVYHSRQHVLNLTGYNWVRLNVTSANGGGWVSINFDIHNASQGIQDDWIFLGDSITAGGMAVNGNTSFAQMINAAKPGYFPIAECGGTGAIFSTDGASHISTYLSIFPGKYVGIAFGTNDSWGNQTGAAKYYTNTETMVKAVLAAGKIPVVSKIPWSALTDINTNAPSYNAQIDALYTAYPEIIKGPDFWTFFKNNPTLLSGDNVHPNDAGYTAMRQQWADTMLAAVYNGVSQTPTPTPSTATPTPTPTPSAATATPTPTPSVATPTPTPSTATPTPTPSTATPTPTPSTATPTPTPTAKSTATPTPTPTAGTPAPGGIKVQFFNGNTAASTNTLYTNFKVVNTGTAGVSLSDVKVRYYFTNDGTQADSFACDYSTIGSGNVSGSFAAIAKTNADRYLEVSFSSAAGTLAAGAGAEVKARVWKSDWSNFTQTNDYSFNATSTNYVDATTVTGFIAGALKWGTEP